MENNEKDKNNKKVGSRNPLYMVPMTLCFVVMCAYICLDYYNGGNNDVADRLNSIERRVDELADNTNLLMILHNENFAAVQHATSTRSIIFINSDGTIDRMPSHLYLTPEERRDIEKFVVPQDRYPHDRYPNQHPLQGSDGNDSQGEEAQQDQ